MATRRGPAARACAAATAMLLNRQKPIARSRSAWWPGGRTSANAGSMAEHVLDSLHGSTRGQQRNLGRLR